MTFTRNGYTFRDSVKDPDSQLRQVLRLVNRNYEVDRLSFYLYRGRNEDTLPDAVRYHNGRLRVRPGFGTSFWSALVNARVLINSGFKTDRGYTRYVPGDWFEDWQDEVVAHDMGWSRGWSRSR